MKDWLNEYRVFPRIFSVFYLITSWEILQWFFNNPKITAEQAAFLGIYTTGCVAYLKFYTEYRPNKSEDKK